MSNFSSAMSYSLLLVRCCSWERPHSHFTCVISRVSKSSEKMHQNLFT